MGPVINWFNNEELNIIFLFYFFLSFISAFGPLFGSYKIKIKLNFVSPAPAPSLVYSILQYLKINWKNWLENFATFFKLLVTKELELVLKILDLTPRARLHTILVFTKTTYSYVNPEYWLGFWISRLICRGTAARGKVQESRPANLTLQYR